MKKVSSLLVFISILSAQQSAPDTSWTKIIGDANYGVANSIIEINDGYVLAGQSWVAETNSTDAIVVKMNFDGDTLWSNSFNGMLQGQSEDIAHDIKQTEDNGFIIVGHKSANNENLNSGYRDIWVIKLDSNGDTLWTKSYGVQYNYYSGYSIQQTFDDGFIISGQCGNQPCLLKIDSLGLREWIRSYQISFLLARIHLMKTKRHLQYSQILWAFNTGQAPILIKGKEVVVVVLLKHTMNHLYILDPLVMTLV